MRNIIIVSLICIPIFIYSQDRTCIIVDKNNNLPIEYCNIKILNKNAGSYSDLNGFFKYNKNGNDTLIISHIAYQTISLPVKFINDTIKLNANEVLLNEITLGTYPVESKNWSKVKNSKSQWYIQPKTEFSVLLKYSKEASSISQIRFPIQYLDNLKSESVYFAIFRLNIYKNINGKIGDKLNSGNIISYFDSKIKEFIQFSLDETIEIPKNGFFIGLEFIGFEDLDRKILVNEKNNFIKLEFTTTEISATYFTNKFINNGKWTLLEEKSNVFPFELKNSLDLILLYK